MGEQERDAEAADGPGGTPEAEEAGAGEFELPLPDEETEAGGRRLRRGLFGYRADDVEAAIASRDEALTVLRRDVAALWLAFGQHERAIRQLTAAVEALGGPRVEAPGRAEGDSEAPTAPATATAGAAAGSGAEPAPEAAEAIGAQLAGLDEVLAAIEQATQSLERAYAGEIGDEGERPQAEAAAEQERPDRSEEPDGDAGRNG